MMRWLIRMNLVCLASLALAYVVISTSRLVLGLLFFLAAFWYERIEEFSQDFLVSPCLERFPRSSRKVIEARYRWAARLVLAIWGILWTARGLSAPAGSAWHIPPGLVFTWAGIAVFFLTVIELARCWAAGGVETYEQYHARFTPIARGLGVLLVAASLYVTYLYLP